MVNKQFLVFLGVGLAVVGAVIFFTLAGTKGAHLVLEGHVLKVRTMPADENSTVVIVDFRVTNPSDVPFVVQNAEIQVDTTAGDTLTGVGVSKVDMDRYFQYNKLIGPKYNDMLSIPDKIMPHQTIDRMVAARVDLPEPQLNARKALRVRITEIDGLVQDIQ